VKVSATRPFLLLGLLLLFASCGTATSPPPTATPPARPVATLFPTLAAIAPAAATQPPAPGATAVPDTGWQAGASGVELRRVRVTIAPERAEVPVTIARIDPARVRLRVAYTPDKPLPLRAWFAAGHALAAINGSFFREDNQTAALLISDGAASGASYNGFGGMLAVAPGGGVSIQPLRDQPYDPSETLDQALQSFPMLVFPGGEVAQFDDNGQRARRSAVAIDRGGRLLLIACPTSAFTLHELAEWLSRSDLDIDRALNLDGGPSTGLFVRDGDLSEEIDSFGPLPIVLMVEEK
jgi:uncharacterized protein YigE (DUF2233 family)